VLPAFHIVAHLAVGVYAIPEGRCAYLNRQYPTTSPNQTAETTALVFDVAHTLDTLDTVDSFGKSRNMDAKLDTQYEYSD
jgi:hypothetical protein